MHPAHMETLARFMAYQIESTGGASLSKTGRTPKRGGFMVSLKGYEQKFNNPKGDDLIRILMGYINDNKADIIPGHFFGAWTSDGWLYLDISERLDTPQQALEALEERDQLAVYWLDGDGVSLDADELRELIG